MYVETQEVKKMSTPPVPIANDKYYRSELSMYRTRKNITRCKLVMNKACCQFLGFIDLRFNPALIRHIIFKLNCRACLQAS